MKDKLLGLFQKLRSSRKAQIGLALTIVLVGLAIYLICFHKSASPPQQESEVGATSSAEAYAHSLESRLENILSNVKGAGNVKVLVTLGSGFEYVYATEETVKETSSGLVTTTEVVLVGGEPIVIKEIYPVVTGVLVSATGAGDVSVKLNLVTAIQTVVDVANEDITILLGQ